MAKKPQKRESYNPLLKSYPDSEKINAVSEGAEILYVRLIAQSDDRGRYWGDPQIILAKLFTHRMAAGQLTVRDITNRLIELVQADLIQFYTAGGKQYLQMLNVVKRLRADCAPHLFCPEPDTAVVTTSLRRRDDVGPPTGPNPTQPNQTPDSGSPADPGSGAYAEVTEQTLRSDEDLESWFQAGKRFKVLGSQCDRLRVFMAAEHALRIGDNPAALFVDTLRKRRWQVLTSADEDAAQARLRRLEARERGPPTEQAVALAVKISARVREADDVDPEENRRNILRSLGR